MANPYLSPANQTVVQNITSQVTSALNNAVGDAVNSVTDSIASALSTSGLPGGAAAVIASAGVNQLISGGASFFDSGSPDRISTNGLINRNLTSITTSNPETAIPYSQTTTTGGATYCYPPVPGPYYLKLDFAKYARPDPLSNTTLNSIGSVILPMPNGEGLKDATQADWQSKNLGKWGNIMDNLKRVTGGAQMQDWKQLMSNGADAALYGIDDAVSNMGGGAGELTQAMESANGLAPNPALSMIFGGVSFRTFQFSWTFVPRNDAESNTIRDMVKFIKAKQLPTFTGSGHNQGSSFFFDYPAIVKPSFGLGQEYMTDFKYCVITDVTAHFSPIGEAPSFYSSTKAPVAVALSISLTEMELRTATDYDPTAVGNGSAAATVAANVKSAINSVIPGSSQVLGTLSGFGG
jgi:hypothetical protein